MWFTGDGRLPVRSVRLFLELTGFQDNSGNGNEPSDDDDDDGYWDQYDQAAGIQATEERGQSGSEETREPEQSALNDAYYNQYDSVETTIGESNLMQEPVANLAQARGGDGKSAPERLSDSREVDAGLDEYVRDTVRNLSRFALRRGMSEARLAELIKEGLN